MYGAVRVGIAFWTLLYHAYPITCEEMMQICHMQLGQSLHKMTGALRTDTPHSTEIDALSLVV